MALLASVLVTGCSGGGSSEAKEGKSPPPSAEDQAFYKCMEKNGIILEERDDVLRVDKDKNDAASQAAAQAKCTHLSADRDAASVAPAPEAFVAEMKKFSACIRENGFPDYPDPDPKTAEVDLGDDADELYKSPEFMAAAQKCSPSDPGGDIVGG
ncbi:hypothetical protein [Streptomyces sp. O3]